MKCLPLNKIASANGTVLHDWHAEIIALRAFNRFLLDECYRLVSSVGDAKSSILRRRSDDEIFASGGRQIFAVRDGLRFFIYCSEAPCGDASMELVMKRQEDPTPWALDRQDADGAGLLGRGSFAELGVVRRKPCMLSSFTYTNSVPADAVVGRADSPVTLSKSCSDKLALKQCTSILAGATSLLISPENAYLDTLILPKAQCLQKGCERAFGLRGRMVSLDGKCWSSNYSFRPFKIASTELEFQYSRQKSQHRSEVAKGSNTSAIWTPNFIETLVNGVLQGRKQSDPKGASRLSRRRMMELVRNIAEVGSTPESIAVPYFSYREAKEAQNLLDRRRVKADVTKEALRGWHKNAEDDFELLAPEMLTLPIESREHKAHLLH